MHDWLSSDAGAVLVESEKLLLEQELCTIFGYHACQFSSVPEADMLQTTPISRQFILTPNVLSGEPRSLLQADPNHWPVSPGCLDLVLLHHTLEVAENPHRLLSEAANTIIPEGKLIVIGFNPISLGGLTRWLLPRQRRLLHHAHFITSWRLRDWLKLLNFHVERCHYGGYLYPASQMMKGLQGKLVEQKCDYMHLPLGGFYMMVATREAPGMTPIRKPWTPVSPRLVGHTIPRPSASSSMDRHATSGDFQNINHSDSD
ncbi:hypothetical protein ACH42_04675 [Endozoicomonas sp. (ex Bugula neritina AB1)]|nr:hypothetical protein ACH42_04675 [Endozoicomonas sp. (ex Bugula neritina AB1)]